MDIVKFVNIAAAIIGTISQAGFFTQAYKIYSGKSSKSVSISTYFLFLPNVSIWLVFGLVTHQKAVVIPNVAAVIGCLAVIVLYYKYSSNTKNLSDDSSNKLIGSKLDYENLKLKRRLSSKSAAI